MIAVVSTAGSNLASVEFALQRLNAPFKLTDKPDEIVAADRVILPGVGHAAEMMRRLKEKRLDEVIRGLVQPTLGICLGMQLLFQSSEEGDTECLGIIPGKVTKFRSEGLIVPHMGWNEVKSCLIPDSLCDVIHNQDCYFVHSFVADRGDWCLAEAYYGDPFPAVVRHNNFIGAQFHPENLGMRDNFF